MTTDSTLVAANCAGLISTIAALSSDTHIFVRTCRDSRRDLDKVSRELQSLQSVLGLIQEDAEDEDKPFPPAIGQHVSGIVSNCNSVVLKIQSCITEYGDSRLEPKATWTVTRQGDMQKLRTSLEAHKSALELALDMLALALTEDAKADTTELRHNTNMVKDDTAQIFEEIDRLQSQLSDEAITPNDSVLQGLLQEMRGYAQATVGTTSADVDGSSRALPYDTGRAKGAAPPLLEVPGSKETQGQDSSLFSPDELKAFLEQPDFPSHVHTHSSRPNSPQDHEGSVATPAAPAPAVDEQSSAPSPPLPPPMPPRPEPQNHQERTSEGDNLTAGSDAADRRAKGKQPYKSTRENPIDARKLRETFYAVASKATRRKSPEREKLIRNEPVSDSMGVHAKLFHGNLAIDCPLPVDIVALDTAAPSDAGSNEFTHWRFTAVTCPSTEFVSQNYVLRPMLFSKPRPVKAVLSFRLDPGEDLFDFIDRLYLIRKSIETLQGIKSFTRDPRDPSSAALPSMEVWKHIVVHIHGPMNWEGLDETIVKSLETLGAKQVLESVLTSLDGQALEPTYQEDAAALQGKTIHCIIRECSTRLTPVLKSYLSVRTRKLKEFTAGTPIQIISTATSGDSPQDVQRDYEQWVTALGELLRPNLIVDMTKFKDMDVDKRFFLWGSMAHKERLVTKEGFSDIGLKVIDFADLRKQLHDIEKAQRKSSKDVHKEKPRSPERNNGVET